MDTDNKRFRALLVPLIDTEERSHICGSINDHSCRALLPNWVDVLLQAALNIFAESVNAFAAQLTIVLHGCVVPHHGTSSVRHEHDQSYV